MQSYSSSSRSLVRLYYFMNIGALQQSVNTCRTKMSKNELHRIEAKDTAYCYRGSVVCVSLCACLLVTTVSPANTAEPIKVPFVNACVDHRNHVLTESPDQRNVNRAVIGNELQPIVKYMEYPACAPYSQLYTEGGSCDGAIR